MDGYQLLFLAAFIPLIPVLSPGSPLPLLWQGVFVALLSVVMLGSGSVMLIALWRRGR